MERKYLTVTDVTKYLKYKCNVKNKPIYVIPTGIDIVPFKHSNFSDSQRDELKSSLGIKSNDVDLCTNATPEDFKKILNKKSN